MSDAKCVQAEAFDETKTKALVLKSRTPNFHSIWFFSLIFAFSNYFNKFSNIFFFLKDKLHLKVLIFCFSKKKKLKCEYLNFALEFLEFKLYLKFYFIFFKRIHCWYFLIIIFYYFKSYFIYYIILFYNTPIILNSNLLYHSLK